MRWQTILLLALACTACQSQIPYVARSATTDYWHPVRAKVEDSGKLMQCSGYIGRDEAGTLFVSLYPRDHYRGDLLTGEERKVYWLSREFKNGEASFLSSTWYTDSQPAMVHSALMMMEFDLSKENAEGRFWELWLHDPDGDWEAEPNRREWRATRVHGGFEEVAIIGRGGPWKTRPDDAFPVLEEVSPGKFTLDGIRLMQPYWMILDWRGEDSPFSDS